MAFAHPEYLYLLLLVIPAIVWYIIYHNRIQAEIQVSTLSQLVDAKNGMRYYLRHFPFILRMLACIALILVLARPQSTNRWNDESVEGIDIMLALDISGSMLAADFAPNRIEASKDVAIEFVSGRPNDRIGLVLFGGESFTQCPLTTDHAVLINLIQKVNVGIVEDQSTAIGLGLANAVKRLKESAARSRVLILVTDGENNAGSIDPYTAADIAKTFGVRLYTIGVGTRGMAPFPVQDRFGNIYYQQAKVEIDEEMLREIALFTNGEYFRATDKEKLRAIYDQINQLETTKTDVRQYSRKYEEFRIFGVWALLFVFVEVIIRNVFLRSMV
ncbi:MAG: VWA domain-containing protein [Bacteroidales bacterium]|nr:VWA domain-containing protein [Bacteroidales bacterium]